jgi:transcriptional regulator with XRE-family HTH domain
MKAHGMTQQAMADQLEMRRQGVTRILAGEVSLLTGSVARMLQALDLELVVRAVRRDG